MQKKSGISTMIMFLVAMQPVDFEPTRTHFCAGINEASVNILNTSSLPPIRCEYIVGYGSGLIFTCKELSEVSKRKVHRNRAVFG